jgi:uridine kinase
MHAESPQLIGIVGGSCAGKTWLAQRLVERFAGESARLSLDDFYRDRQHLTAAQRRRVNFDHPRAIDWPLVSEAVRALAGGQAARVPRYDFAVHGRRSDWSALSPVRFIFMEGLWLFRRADVRRWFSLKIFIQSAAGLCAERRIERDVRERGRTPEQVIEQFTRHTLPMQERFVAGQERWADLVLEAPVADEAVREIEAKIRKGASCCAAGI